MKFIKYRKLLKEDIDVSKLHNMSDLTNIDNDDINEELLTEAKADIDAFTNKFGKNTYDFITKYKQRFINNNISTDISYHTKNTSKEQMDKIIIDLSNKVVKDEKGDTRLNYNYLGDSKGFKVYEILDWQTAMNMGDGTGWCISGRYDTDEVKPSQAKKYFNEYTEEGYRFFYFISENTKYCLQLTPGKFNKISNYNMNFILWSAEDRTVQKLDIINSLPINLVKEVEIKEVEKFEIKDKVLIKYNGDDESVTIPNGITSIGVGAFNNCSSLTSVTIPDSITSIGSDAFAWCKSLTTITIPDSVTSIGERTFINCYGLTNITIPDRVTRVDRGTFAGCDSLTSVTIPDNVTSIGNGAFSYCYSLTSVTIPDSVTSIGNSAFYNCYSLTSVTIGNSVTSISSDAFYECNSLSHITYKGTAKQYIKLIKDNRLFTLLDCKVTLADGSTYNDAADVLQKVKETNESYSDKEDINYRKQIYAENKLRNNRNILIDKYIPEEVIDTIENISSLRHKLHSTDRNDGNLIIEIMDKIREEIYRLPEELRPSINRLRYPSSETYWEELPIDTDDFSNNEDMCDNLLGDYEKDEDDYPTDGEVDKALLKIYETNNSIVEEINTDIEHWLEDIDKKYGTSYKPTGSNRLL